MPTFFSETFTGLFALLGFFGVTVTTVVGITFAAFQLLAKSWLKAQFDRDLEHFKAANTLELERAKGEFQRETERLRAEISRLADRASRFHEREYEVLPEAWGLLNKAYGATSEAVNAFQRSPDFDHMPLEEMEEVFDVLKLSETDRRDVRNADRRNEVYLGIQTRVQLARADAANVEFNNFIILNGIFIEDLIAAKLTAAAAALRRAVINRQLHREDRARDLWMEAHEGVEKAGALVEEIKADVKRRLWATQLPATDVKGS